MPKSLLLKQQEAKERQDKRDKRSPADQLSHLDSVFGKNLGAKKERAKLLSRIDKGDEPKEEKRKKTKKKKTDE